VSAQKGRKRGNKMGRLNDRDNIRNINSFNRKANRNGRINRRRAGRERTILVTSSALVLAAMTMAGIYMNRNDKQNTDDGYTLDFSALENTTDNKLNEIANNKTENSLKAGIDDDLDYIQDIEVENLAEEAGSALVSIGTKTQTEVEEMPQTDILESASAPEVQLQFASELEKPVEGETIIPYSMDKSVYFSTLDQYKYNPAMIIQAAEGEPVLACAKGKVADIYSSAELGEVVVLELGDDYRAVYGQLTDINVTVGQYVNAGEQIASVASPTKYYSTEGSNLYFKLEQGENALNPEDFF
jgi:murein DD-endopeptidase MepM/ murein hydrolase activator NlpD